MKELQQVQSRHGRLAARLRRRIRSRLACANVDDGRRWLKLRSSEERWSVQKAEYPRLHVDSASPANGYATYAHHGNAYAAGDVGDAACGEYR